MRSAWFVTPPYFLVLGFLCGAVGFRMGWRTGSRLALPLIQGLLGWGAFALSWSFVGPVWAAATVLAWALGVTAVSLYAFHGSPEVADERVVRAREYRERMLPWLETGRGPETVPLRTAREHLRELVLFVLAAAATANVLSLVLGAVLLNYMNAYVATLLRAARRPGVVLLLGWNVWSIVRVAAYVALGAAAAAPLLRLFGFAGDLEVAQRLGAVGLAGAASDLSLKLALSGAAGSRLAAAVDLEAVRANRAPAAGPTLGL